MMHGDIFPGRLLFATLLASAMTALCAVECRADIYRFVTVDGVETFTDAPLSKDAKVVIKDRTAHAPKSRGNVKKQKNHDISLNEIVEKTVTASLNPDSLAALPSRPVLPPVGGVITSGVGMRVDPIDGKWRHHNGIDIAIPEGTPVKPAAPGMVVFSGLRPGYGNTVLIEHDSGMVTLYGHNSRLLVNNGQMVDSETVIALAGSTGRSTGPHLHFEAWQAGTNVTPAFMPGSNMQFPKPHEAALRKRNHFRREVLADGSILFTNIPSSIP